MRRPTRKEAAVIFFVCINKLFSSVGQTYFGIITFLSYSANYGKSLNCQPDHPDPGCPDQFSASFLTPCIIGIVCNISVVGVNRLLNLYLQVMRLDCCSPSRNYHPVSLRSHDSTGQNDDMPLVARKKSAEKNFSNLNRFGKVFVVILVALGIVSGLSVSLSGYFGAVKFLRFLVFLNTKNPKDLAGYNPLWLQTWSAVVGLNNFVTFFAYNISKIRDRAVEFAYGMTCCVSFQEPIDHGNTAAKSSGCQLNRTNVITAILILLILFFSPMVAFFTTSHAIQLLGHAVGQGDYVDDVVNNNTGDTSLPPSAAVDIATLFTLPSALTYALLTSVVAIRKLLKNHNAFRSYVDKPWKIWYWLAGIGDSMFSALGGYMAVVSTTDAINHGHFSFIHMRFSEEAKFTLQIINGLHAGVSNFAFNVFEGYEDFLGDCKKYDAPSEGAQPIVNPPPVALLKEPLLAAGSHSDTPFASDIELGETSSRSSMNGSYDPPLLPGNNNRSNHFGTAVEFSEVKQQSPRMQSATPNHLLPSSNSAAFFDRPQPSNKSLPVDNGAQVNGYHFVLQLGGSVK